MLTVFRVDVTLAQPIVNEIDNIGFGASAHAKVLWLHIPMKELFVVEILKPLTHLLPY
jgi:hypothetical protein